MSKYRRAAKVDDNQYLIVSMLREIPGVSVSVSHDDILVGYKGKTYWYEIKSIRAVSKKTGNILESEIKDSQKELRSTFKGHYKIVSSLTEILEDIGIIL